jgi:prepilin-type N-terminal cleavage/methylation domain-containing protein
MRLPACRGFTLIELLVVVAIMLVLTTMVVVLFNTNYNSERIRGAARQTQSIMLGAQSRAALKREARGIRLILDQTDPTTATSFVYIGPPKEWRTGTVQIRRPDTDGTDNDGDGLKDGDGIADSDNPFYLWGYGTGWKRLYDQKLLVDGARIRLPSNGSWYTVSVNPANFTDKREVLVLNTEYRVQPPTYPYDPSPMGLKPVMAYNPTDYVLELQPGILGDEQPVLLPSGIVIDLYHSRIPSYWYDEVTTATNGYTMEGPSRQDSTKTAYRQYFPQKLDILFSPRGMVQGPLAAQGIVHFLLADRFDTDQQRNPITAERENMVSTLFTRTGLVSTHHVFKLGPDGTPGTADDYTFNELFRYAETGAVAGK